MFTMSGQQIDKEAEIEPALSVGHICRQPVRNIWRHESFPTSIQRQGGIEPWTLESGFKGDEICLDWLVCILKWRHFLQSMAVLHALSYAYFEKAEDDVNSFKKVLSLMIGKQDNSKFHMQ